MFALIHTTTDENDTNLPTLLAAGEEGSQEVLEQFSDSLAELMPKWDECTFTLNGESTTGKVLAFSEVVESFFSGNRHELAVTYADKQSAAGWCTESWVLMAIPPSARLRAAYAQAQVDKWDKDIDLCSYAGTSGSEAYRKKTVWEKVAEYWVERIFN